MDYTQDKILWQRCIDGDKEAWDKFVKRYTRLVYSAIYKTLHSFRLEKDIAMAEDIHQEVFVSLFENTYAKLRSFEWRNTCSLSGWLFVVARYAAINYIVKENRKRDLTKSLEDPVAGTEDLKIKDTIDVDKYTNMDGLERKEILRLFIDYIETLDTVDRYILDASCLKKMPAKQIALVLRKTEEAVSKRKERAMEEFRKLIKKDVGS